MYTTQPKQLWFLELVNGIRTHQWTGNTTVEIYEIIIVSYLQVYYKSHNETSSQVSQLSL